MNINSVSPSFGSLQVATSKMNNKQMDLSDKFCDSLKYDDTYQTLEDQDVDVYVLPGKNDSQIDVRVMDPYSGNFIRSNDRHIIKQKLSTRSSEEAIRKAADSIIDTIKSVVAGLIKRPKADVVNIFEGKTAMARLNPDKYKSFDRDLKYWIDAGVDLDDALDMSYDNFVSMYRIGNVDKDF